MFEDMRAAMGEVDPDQTPDQSTPDPDTTPIVPLSDPGPTPVRNIRIPNGQWIRLRQYAQANGLSIGAAVRMAIAEFLRGRA